MLLEGLTQFHQNSIWIFQPDPLLAKCDYIFSPLDSSLVREQHLYPAHMRRGFLWYTRHEGLARPADDRRLVTLRPGTKHLINNMAVTGGDQSAVQKIKLDLNIRHSIWNKNWGGNNLISHVKVKFPQLERLAVHSHLRSFEVIIDVEMWPRDSVDKREYADNTIADLIAELGKIGAALIPTGSTRITGGPREQPRLSYPLDYYKQLIWCRERTRGSGPTS